MSDVRCDLTDLLTTQCAHCLGQLDREPAADLHVERVITAVYDGRCAVEARHAIAIGDRIGHTEHGWVCERCCTEAGAR